MKSNANTAVQPQLRYCREKQCYCTNANWHGECSITACNKKEVKSLHTQCKNFTFEMKQSNDKELMDKLYPIGSFFFTYLHLEEHDPNKFFRNTTWVYTGHDHIKKFWKRVR